jgi:hypothetical protein
MALEGCGDEHVFVQIDVQDFFGSISHEWLESNLPLDRGTIRRHIHTGEMNLQFKDEACQQNVRLSRTARRAIPQGSALSQLIAELVMAEVLREVVAPPGVQIITYCDNIGIIMPKGCEAVVKELMRAAFEQHNAGPFKLTISEPVPVTQEFEFLGLSFIVEEERPKVEVPEKVWGTWLCQIGDDVLVANMAALQELERKVLGKIAQWRMWSGADELKADALCLIESQREALSSRSNGEDSSPPQPAAQ